ncbi:PLP-dependent aminotransferase family protein [Rhizobium bangladeshense]|uniref:aminotransferase-like domain-containing protein n=1 Tax=Rhizobium bangladeshense TaxID=1138189 RepID=UPI001A998933|nr:PLP-dependent aminotransferase family protein [Rhizobium bangladeshense]MBX4930557.1 PLP-dependent aminotransferase family protein [Rhizobium bangladeshense]MBY3581141.1 PLP-dependent aminotransferase family protein [Rhizobium bangladeshense]QSY87214.1 PLP-dependent aminotransferase family protein [Rhizobium bangladeshense]
MVQETVRMNEEIAGRTRVQMVMATIRQRIAGRSLTPGARLPSVRRLAASMKLSTSTVVDAYERLVAEGAILSRPGSGFYVANQAAPFALAEAGPKLDRAVDPFWISRQSLEAGESDLKPGCGWLPPSWLPGEAMRRGLRTLARAEGPALADYGSPLGLPALRQLISRRMGERGIEASPDQILLAESGTQAIDLLCRFLLEAGDTVLVDDPCYFNFHALLRAHRAKIVSVPYTPSGPDLELFAQTLAEHRPRLYITNSAIHNPTGATLSPVTAHRVLKLADQFDLTIIEDDIFADFEYTPAPRLAAFDGLERVIHIGSFSKTLSASARCGFVAARPEWIEGLTDLKIATSFGGGRMTAELVLNVLSDGGYRKHMEMLRQRLAGAMTEVSARLKGLGIMPWLEPQAGMFLWCRLPDGIDAANVARAALEKRIVLAPGNAFSLSQSATNFMRFNVSQTLDARVFAVLADVLGS